MTDPRLFRLRIELFAAAQTLRGQDLKDFWQLIEDVRSVREAFSPESDEGATP